MKIIIRAIGIFSISIVGLTSCGIGSLPHNERYMKIDRALSDIDYQNIGTIVHEEIDNGDGIFSPSYKMIYYKEDIAFDEIFSKLQHAPNDVNEDCSEIHLSPSQVNNRKNIYCNYYGNGIDLIRKKNNEYHSQTQILITDSTSGKGK